MIRRNDLGGWLLVVLIAARCIWLIAHGPNGILGMFEDDAQYYLVIAENIVRTGHSTFDGTTLTTGYHPAWLGIEVALVWLSGNSRVIYLTALVVVCGVLAFLHVRMLRRLLSGLSSSPAWVDIVVLLVVTRSLNLSFDGMESALAMPMMAWCALETWRQLETSLVPRRLAYLGFIAALTGLARIDAIVFGVACGALVIARAARDRWMPRASNATTPPSAEPALGRSMAAFVLGLAPFFAFVAALWFFTGSAMTTSAQAKTLAQGLHWSSAWFSRITWGDRISFLFVSGVALALLCSPWTPWRDARRALALTVFAFPIFYYTYIGLRTSWSLWAWYLYPAPLCTSIALVALAEWVKVRAPDLARRAAGYSPVALAVAALLSVAMVAKTWTARGNNEGVVRAAIALGSFCATHPGKYGMGDRAGTTAYLNPCSFLQLEGLVADTSLLDAIRHERSLASTLVEYRVDYLVEALPTRAIGTGCQTFLEPNAKQAGPRSPKMRGEFCELMFRYDDEHDGMTTMVYRVPSAI
jgi:hypothetical protein